MEHLNIFIIQLATVLLPGIVWTRIDVRYASMEKPTEVEFFLRAFVYGLTSYAVTALIYAACRWPFVIWDVTEADKKLVITPQVGQEIVFATAVAFILGVLWVYASTWKVMTRLLQFIRATKKFGDEDVWDFTFNAQSAAVQYVNLRDFDKRIVYTGWVNAFSETEKLRELTLYDVQIYDFEGVLMFSVPRIYLARKPDDIHIEFPLSTGSRHDRTPDRARRLLPEAWTAFGRVPPQRRAESADPSGDPAAAAPISDASS